MINKDSLISKASKESGVPRKYIVEGVEPFLKCLKEALSSGEEVYLFEIGRFEIKEYPGYMGFVPNSKRDHSDGVQDEGSKGRRVHLPLRRVLKFYPSPRVKKAINEIETDQR